MSLLVTLFILKGGGGSRVISRRAPFTSLVVKRRGIMTTTTPTSSSSKSKTKPSKGAYDFDFIVIGGGSAGLAASKEAASLGAKVCLFDYVTESPRGNTWGLGGTCVNVGCIPKKMMHISSLVGKEYLSYAGSYGWILQQGNTKPFLNWSSLVNNVQERIKGTNWTYRVALRDTNVAYENAMAEFVDPHTVQGIYFSKSGEKKSKLFTADKILVAVGSRPHYPDEVKGALQYGITSDDLFSLKDPPGKTLVVGASFIALETAGILSGLGIDTTVMIRSVMLRGFDQQMAEMVGGYLQSDCGVKLQRSRVPLSIEPVKVSRSESQRLFEVSSKSTVTNESFKEQFNTVMFATGRRPSTSNMKLDKIGVKVDKDGKVVAGPDDATAVPNVFAIGDCTKDRPELTPAAVQAGLLLAKRLFGKGTLLTDYVNCPTTIFTPLEYGCVGLSEEKAIEKHGAKDIEVYHTYFQPFEFQLPETNKNKAYAKLICRKSEKERVLGLHYFGPNAGEVVQGFAVAIRLGATKDDLAATIGIHPTSAENFTILLNITKASGKDPMKQGCCG